MAKHALVWWFILKQAVPVALHKIWNIKELAH